MCRWNTAVNVLTTYRNLVEKTLEISVLTENCKSSNDDILEINEKLDNMDFENNIQQILSNLRLFQNYLVPRVQVIEDQVKANDMKAQFIITKYPTDKTRVNIIIKNVQDAWKSLKIKCDGKERVLKQALELAQFKELQEDLETWIEKIYERFTTDDTITSIYSCEMAISTHHETKVCVMVFIFVLTCFLSRYC